MTIINYYDVPQNSFSTVALSRTAIGLRIENNSNQFITVRDDLSHDVAACPPGLSAAWNRLEGLHTPQIGCIGYYQGSARVYFYDTQLDTTSNPPLEQPPGSITTVPSGTQAVSGNFIDPTVAANTSALLGTLPSTQVAISAHFGADGTYALARAIVALTIAATNVRTSGALTVTASFNGLTTPLVDGLYITGDNGYDFGATIHEALPSGTVVGVSFDGDADFAMRL